MSAQTRKALYEKKGKLWKRADELNKLTITESRDFTSEERAEFEKCHSELTVVCRQIEDDKKLEAMGEERSEGGTIVLPGREDRRGRRTKRSKMERAEIKEETRKLAFNALTRVALGRSLRREHIRACEALRIDPRSKKFRYCLADTEHLAAAQNECREVHPKLHKRTLSSQTFNAGASWIPSSFVNAVEINRLATGGFLSEIEVIRTDSGGPMGWPTADDASNEGAMVGEAVSMGSGETDPTTGLQNWGAFKGKSGVIKAAYEWLEDSGVDAAAALGKMIGLRMGRLQTRKYTLGTGAGEPEGIVVGSAVGKTCAATNAFTVNECLDFIHSVDPEFRIGAKLMMHDSIVLLLRKIKETGTDQPMWQPGLRDGVPDRFLGYELVINQYMASSLAASAVPMLFGQLSMYKSREVGQGRFYRLEERYRDEDCDGFLAIQRFDGRLLRASNTNTAVKKLQLAAA